MANVSCYEHGTSKAKADCIPGSTGVKRALSILKFVFTMIMQCTVQIITRVHKYHDPTQWCEKETYAKRILIICNCIYW